MKKELHLDNEYRRRWELFYLEDGTIKDSREINWRDVEWDKVVKVTIFMEGKEYSVKKKGLRFKGFMNFRVGGKIAQYDEKGKYKGHKNIHEWVIGIIKGKSCSLMYIDFYTGNLIKETTEEISNLKNHIHPKLKI